jgi:hypothetical protein
MARNPIIRENPPTVPAPTEETPHACWGGWVFLGFEGEDGEEHVERVPCRHCRPETL